jgi:Rne/Rng family ribonuclease
MNKELYVSSTPHETKVALVEDDQLAEVFFERENEYTLAGSIYKGRVTRVLPGMQSAFVDIGLERDAFLYVSDFLELPSDEEDGDEFGQIPTPRTTVDVSNSPPAHEARSLESRSSISETENEEEEPSAPLEELASPVEEDSTVGEIEAQPGEDQDSSEGARRWRGRRRRGGRRGRPDGREDMAETKTATVEEPQAPAPARAETRPPATAGRPRSDFGPPAGYAPIILPGESISKYRNQAQQPVTEPPREIASEEATDTRDAFSPSHSLHVEEDKRREVAPPTATAAVIAFEETEEVEAAHDYEERYQGETRSVAPLEPLPSEPESHGSQTFESAAIERLAASPQNQEEDVVEDESEAEIHAGSLPTSDEHLEHTSPPVDTAAHDLQRLTAPSEAPEGRTLEHEVLEDEETEFHPVPDDISALSEVAGDEELVLEEETLDSDNGYSERWIPKIEDVDEDEVVAAEMRGEHIYGVEADEVEEKDNGEPEETNGRAELRASSATAGYQQRQVERPGYERRYRDRSRRGGPRRGFRARPNDNRNQPLITDLLKEGQEVLIQIAKEPIGKKGARITSHIALPGRFLVYMPTVNHVGVSRKIASEEERLRLKRIVTSERENGLGGFIVRTAAAHIREEDLRADIRFLKHLWAEIKSRADNSKSPALIYHDLNLVERVLRDQVNADFSQIWVDTEDEYERVVRFANRFQPSLVRRIKLYTKDTPLFEEFSIQEEINRSLKSKVWLKSGGYLVINQTEALVAIDINTGKYVGKTQRLEDTIVKTNVDAVKEIVRQVRLRDLGGIIVIDFIDMDERRNRQKVMQALEEALRNDRAPSKVLQFNDFGLVAITRKRVKQSLERTLGEPCPYCTGAGFVKSVTTVCNELYIEMRKMAKLHDRTDITVRVNPEIAKALKGNNGKLIGELEDLTGKTVLVKSDPTLHQENFDIH